MAGLRPMGPGFAAGTIVLDDHAPMLGKDPGQWDGCARVPQPAPRRSRRPPWPGIARAFALLSLLAQVVILADAPM